MAIDSGTVAYAYRDGLYLNLTNHCPTVCRFCVKRAWRWSYRGRDLRLGGQEPSVRQVLQAVDSGLAERPCRELVFCGYGECTYRLPEMLEICRQTREKYPALRLRLNTIGLGSLIWGRDITPALGARLHAVCVSLNTADPAQWLELHAPLEGYRKAGFAGVLQFVEGCVRAGLDTTVTAVDQPGVNLSAVERLAGALGARFRPRPSLT